MKHYVRGRIKTNSRTNLLLKLRMLEVKMDLKTRSDFYSLFRTHMNYYYDLNSDNIYPAKTYLNGEDVSSLFNIYGFDALDRIYDLYRG